MYMSWDLHRYIVVETNPISPCPSRDYTQDRVRRATPCLNAADLLESHRYIHLCRSPVHTSPLRSSTRQHRKRRQNGRCCYVGIKKSGRYLLRSPLNRRETLRHEGLWKTKCSLNDISTTPSKTETQLQETQAFDTHQFAIHLSWGSGHAVCREKER